MGLIHITGDIAIDPEEIRMDYVRASGPGGQKVNKTSSAVQLRFDAARSPSLPEDVRRRLISLAGKRITREGVLVINARRFRSQERNRQDAIRRLAALARRAAEEPIERLETRPGAASDKRRLVQKRRRSQTKKLRREVPGEDDRGA